jgi:hypothetical protein
MSLGTFHGYRDSVRWRVTPDGIEIEGSGTERTKDRPDIALRAWELFADDINPVADAYRIPCALIVAAICNESAGGDPRAVHMTSGYLSDEETPDKVCVGLMQTLISTASRALEKDVDREWLLQADNSLRAGAAFMQQQSQDTKLDPPLVAAAYAAGRLRYDPSEANRWRLHQGSLRQCLVAGGYTDRFVRFLNDAVQMLGEARTPPSVGIDTLLNGKYKS